MSINHRTVSTSLLSNKKCKKKLIFICWNGMTIFSRTPLANRTVACDVINKWRGGYLRLCSTIIANLLDVSIFFAMLSWKTAFV